MIETCYLNRNTGVATVQGGAAFRLQLRLDSTFNLGVAFMDDNGAVIALPSGSSGRFVVKPVDRFMSGPRYIMHSWTVSGEGAARRYHFSALLDSAPLRADFGNLPSKEYAVQIEYTINGAKYLSEDIPCTIRNSYFQAVDVAPGLPLGGSERVDFFAEVFPPGMLVGDGTDYAGNINSGGDLHSVRLSVKNYAPGATVQIKINGSTNLFAAPVPITAQSCVWSQDDEDNKLAVATIPDGARIDVVTVFIGGVEYPVAPEALALVISLRTRAAMDMDAWTWLAAHVLGGVRDEEAQTITIPSTPESIGFSVVDGALRFTIGGVTREIPSFEV